MSNFEVHITVSRQPNIDLDEVAKITRLSLIDIDLMNHQATTRFQPMFSFKLNNTNYTNVRVISSYYTKQLETLGLSVVRLKIESDLGNRNSCLYFERHIKINPLGLDFLTVDKERYNARLSTNLVKGSVFITQRSQSVPVTDELLEFLHYNSVQVLKVEDEKVLYDSNLELDAGW